MGTQFPLTIVLSLPRSASSSISKNLVELGLDQFDSGTGFVSSPSQFNQSGYFEDGGLSLLCDQLIRLIGGSNRASFLNPPNFTDLACSMELEEMDSEFSYDLTEETIEIPDDFVQNTSHYTGVQWDPWGLTRMFAGGKWNRCYSRTSVDEFAKIIRRATDIKDQISISKRPLFIKDPRLAFTLHLFKFEKIQVLWVKRNPSDVLASMRRHYGPRLFTQSCFQKFDWVSNHFNYRVPPQDFDSYYLNYNLWIRHQTKMWPTFEFGVHDLESKSFSQCLNHFLKI